MVEKSALKNGGVENVNNEGNHLIEKARWILETERKSKMCQL